MTDTNSDKVKAEDIEDYKSKIIGYRWDFLKYFLGTFILGVAATYSTYIFKDYELQIENRKTESEYLKPYLDKYLSLVESDNLEYKKALDMAEFICRTTTDSSLRKGWISFRDYISVKLTETKNELERNKVQTKSLTTTKIKIINEIKEHRSVNNTHAIDSLKRRLNQIASQLDQSLEQQNELSKKLSLPTQSIQESTPNKIDIKPNYISYETIYDDDVFTGHNYSLYIIDGITVYVDNIYNSTKSITMRIAELDEFSPSLSIDVNETIQHDFDHSKYKVTVTLTKIGLRRLYWVAYYHIIVQRKK